MMLSRRNVSFMVALLLFALPLRVTAQPDLPRTSSEIALALDHLQVLGSVLYVGAHPDDENTAFLAAMAKGRGIRTAYLSITRGEGGQNLIGPEQGATLGVIRTQELLAARRVDGAEQYFTRAIDFGYSKTAEETLRFWNHDSILADVVWVIRSFRPDVIVTRFTPQAGGHGNHTASAMLAMEAFHAAADPSRFPGQLRFASTWQAKRLLWNVFRFDPADSVRTSGIVRADLGEYSPLLGRSFAELAGEGRSMHKSQGFGAPQNRGEAVNSFQHLLGDTAAQDLFDGIPLSWSRVTGSDAAASAIEQASAGFTPRNPAACVPALMRAAAALDAIPAQPWVGIKKAQVNALIMACSGLWVEFATPVASTPPGSDLPVTFTIVNRSGAPFTLESVRFPFSLVDSGASTSLAASKPFRMQTSIQLPPALSYSQPYWLESPASAGAYTVASQERIGVAEDASRINANVRLSHPDGALTLSVPLRHKTIDPVDGEVYNPFAVTPPVDVRVREPVLLFNGTSTKTLHVSVTGGDRAVDGTLRLVLPPGWSASPRQLEMKLAPGAGEVVYRFQVSATAHASSGIAYAEVGTGQIRTSTTIETVNYKHIPRQVILTPARASLLHSGIISPGGRAAYIEGAGDGLPAAMQQLGYRVETLTDDDLAFTDLSGYDVIVAGIRAHNTRPALRRNQGRLMDYVEKGGTYIVHYVTPPRGETLSLGPYPFSLSRDRVAEEDAPVRMLMPGHPVFTTPNAITPGDFNGWIQERGLYFADRWDRAYDSLLASHDTGEPERNGGLLVGRYGRGYFIYNAYAFFRQLPAGVEGAYRLFANILALRNKPQRHVDHGRTPSPNDR
jgi:LmbE family N-acetylglucosaminyl deacetylase